MQDELKAALAGAGISYSAPNLKLCFQFGSLPDLDAAYSALKPHGVAGETPAIIAALAAAQAALIQAAQWFEEYADGHLTAGKTDKANRNLQRANACRRAAASVQQ